MQLNLVGKSKTIEDIRRLVDLVAPTNAKVLIEGERGVGKTLIADLIHDQSPRKSRPSVLVVCADDIESQLFGYVPDDREETHPTDRSILAQATDGTLILDGVDRLSERAQELLLAFLQDGVIVSNESGRHRERRSDIRIIATVDAALREMVSAGRFREDLYHRLNVVPIHVPPLREHRTDIPLLFEHFCSKEISQAAMALLIAYPWPGNVQELRVIAEQFDSTTVRAIEERDVEVALARTADLSIEFSEECSASEVRIVLSALADYYRSCGGIGLRTDFEEVELEQPEAVGV